MARPDSAEHAGRMAPSWRWSESLRALPVGVASVALVLMLPIAPSLKSAALLGVWMCVASLILFLQSRREGRVVTLPRIPISFAGNPGRFRLLSRGDGRRVEVRDGAEVVAEAIATDERDELVLKLDAVEDSELEALGAAIGNAIEMVAVADEDRG